jgi:ABC-type uncharacterized transport system permease subunit
MEKQSDLREELLKQMDRDAGGGPNASQKAVQAILTKDAARLRRVKYLTVSSWLLLAAAFLASGVTGALSGFRSELWGVSSIIGLQALLIIAVAFTVVLSVRARTLKMKQIQAALADIQDQLKAMSVNSGRRPEV